MNFGRVFLALAIGAALVWAWPYWGPLALAAIGDAEKAQSLREIMSPLGLLLMIASAFALLRALRKPRVIQIRQRADLACELHAALRRVPLVVMHIAVSAEAGERALHAQGMPMRMSDGDTVDILGVKEPSERMYAAYNQQTDFAAFNDETAREFARLPTAPRFWFSLGGAILMLRGELWLAPIVAIVLWILVGFGQRWMERRYAALIGACLMERLRLPRAVQTY